MTNYNAVRIFEGAPIFLNFKLRSPTNTSLIFVYFICAKGVENLSDKLFNYHSTYDGHKLNYNHIVQQITSYICFFEHSLWILVSVNFCGNCVKYWPTICLSMTEEYERSTYDHHKLNYSPCSQHICRWDTPIHVDAASGGFIAPFLYPELEWDFRLPLVKSINVSGHKYGLVYAGIGWVIWRTKEDLPEELIFHINYLGADQPTFTLNFSKGG